MAKVLHASLSGADLHENKGVAAATDKAMATASGGTTVWTTAIEPSSVSLTSVVYKQMVIPATSLLRDSNAPTISTFATDFKALLFSGAQNQSVYFNTVLPQDYETGTPIAIKVNWRRTGNYAGDVQWTLKSYSGTTALSNTTAVATDNSLRRTSLHTITPSEKALLFALSRDGLAGADTYPDNIIIFSVEISYQSKKIGSAGE